MNKGSKIVLGAWAWGDNNGYFGNNYDQSHFQEVYGQAVKSGLAFWDTTFTYDAGNSERISESLMEHMPHEGLTISTKFIPQMADNSENPIEQTFEGNLKRLKTDYIDYYWIYNNAGVEKWTPVVVSLAKSGKVKHTGVSNHTLSKIKRVQEILAEADLELDAVQNHLSLLDRTSERTGTLDYCRQNNIELFAHIVSEQDILTSRHNQDSPFPAGSVRIQVYNSKLPQLTELLNNLQAVGDKRGVSIAQTAVAWAMAEGVLPIIGTTEVNQVKDAKAVTQVQLTSPEINQLEEVTDKTNVNTIGSWEQGIQKD